MCLPAVGRSVTGAERFAPLFRGVGARPEPQQRERGATFRLLRDVHASHGERLGYPPGTEGRWCSLLVWENSRDPFFYHNFIEQQLLNNKSVVMFSLKCAKLYLLSGQDKGEGGNLAGHPFFFPQAAVIESCCP